MPNKPDVLSTSRRDFLRNTGIGAAAAAAATIIPQGTARAQGLSPKPENVFTKPEQGDKQLAELFGKANVGIATIKYKAGLEDRNAHQRRALIVDIEALLKQDEGFGGKIVVFGYNILKSEGPEELPSRYIVRKEIELTPDMLEDHFVQNFDGQAAVTNSNGEESFLPSGCLFFPITNTVHHTLKQKPDADLLENNAGYTVAKVPELRPDYDGFAVFVLKEEAENRAKMKPEGFVVTELRKRVKDITGVLINQQGVSAEMGADFSETKQKYDVLAAQAITTMEKGGVLDIPDERG